MHDKPELDRLLDSALKTYAEPEPGLEGRILSSLVEVRTAPRRAASYRRWLYWSAAVPVAAGLLFMLTARKSPQPGLQPQPHPAEQVATAHSAQSEPPFPSSHAPSASHAPIPAMRRPAVHAQLNAAVSKPAALPKLDIFPAPQPLTAEEWALYSFATEVPEKQRQAVLNAQKNDNAPLDVAAIRIPPIEVPAEGNN